MTFKMRCPLGGLTRIFGIIIMMIAVIICITTTPQTMAPETLQKQPSTIENNLVPKEDIEVKPEPEIITETIVYVGEFKITAYCACKKCCGKWAGGNTASGTTPTEGRTIAVDTDVIPFGTEVIIDGHAYVAEDTGSAIKGNRLDIFFESHQRALEWGVQYKDVQIIK